MKVAIAGAGISGAYLYRMLHDRGCTVHLYEQPQKNVCGLTSCAWGSSLEIVTFLDEAGLNAEDYILRRFDHLLMDEVRLRADLLTIDKPRLIRDLLQDAELRYSSLPLKDYDRVIDATGATRALLPQPADDLVLDCCQFMVQSDKPLPSRVRLGGIGYAWSLPLGNRNYHIGCGSLLMDPRRHLDELGWLVEGNQRIICNCKGKIRLTAPHLSQPFVAAIQNTEVWGIGEAIGCVAPLAGEGIVPGLRSVQLLLESWDDPEQYRQAVLDEFLWMAEERAIIEQLRLGGSIGLRQARTVHRNSRRLGLQIGLRNAFALLQKLGRMTSG